MARDKLSGNNGVGSAAAGREKQTNHNWRKFITKAKSQEDTQKQCQQSKPKKTPATRFQQKVKQKIQSNITQKLSRPPVFDEVVGAAGQAGRDLRPLVPKLTMLLKYYRVLNNHHGLSRKIGEGSRRSRERAIPNTVDHTYVFVVAASCETSGLHVFRPFTLPRPGSICL